MSVGKRCPVPVSKLGAKLGRRVLEVGYDATPTAQNQRGQREFVEYARPHRENGRARSQAPKALKTSIATPAYIRRSFGSVPRSPRRRCAEIRFRGVNLRCAFTRSIRGPFSRGQFRHMCPLEPSKVASGTQQPTRCCPVKWSSSHCLSKLGHVGALAYLPSRFQIRVAGKLVT